MQKKKRIEQLHMRKPSHPALFLSPRGETGGKGQVETSYTSGGALCGLRTRC